MAVVLGSAIGLFYYLRLTIIMFMDRERQQRRRAQKDQQKCAVRGAEPEREAAHQVVERVPAGLVLLKKVSVQQVFEDVLGRYAALGWHTQGPVDGHDMDAVAKALETARAVSDKPSIIACRTTIGYGAPNKGGTAAAHGEPLGEDERAYVPLRDRPPPHHPPPPLARPGQIIEGTHQGWGVRSGSYTARHTLSGVCPGVSMARIRQLPKRTSSPSWARWSLSS